MSPLEKQAKRLSTGLLKAASKLEQEVSPKGIHRLRTTIRRLQSLIDYVHPRLSKKQQKTLEELTELRKRAGKIRDLDIQLRLIKAIGNGSTASDRRAIVETIHWTRARQTRRLASLLQELKDSGVFTRLSKLAAKVSGASAPDATFAPLQKAQDVLAELAAGYSRPQDLVPAKLHCLRIELKKVRYTAELAAAAPEQEQFLAAMKSVQDAIGEWHDWETLVKTAEKRFKDRVNCPLLVEMRSLFAAKHIAAASAVTHLFSARTRPRRKQPRSAVTAHKIAQRA